MGKKHKFRSEAEKLAILKAIDKKHAKGMSKVKAVRSSGITPGQDSEWRTKFGIPQTSGIIAKPGNKNKVEFTTLEPKETKPRRQKNKNNDQPMIAFMGTAKQITEAFREMRGM